MVTACKPVMLDEVVQEIRSRYHLGRKGSLLVEETFEIIVGEPSGIDGFLERLARAGLSASVASWLSGTEPAMLSGQQVEETLGSEAISEIAGKAGVTERFARIVVAFAIPRIVSELARCGLVRGLVRVASARDDEFLQLRDRRLPPSEKQAFGLRPRLGQLLVPCAALVITLGLFRFFGAPVGPSHHAVAVEPQHTIARVVPVAPSYAPTMGQSAMAQPALVAHTASIPPHLTLTNENGLIVYSGTVADDDTRSAVLGALEAVFGAEKISGEITVDKQAGPARWAKDLAKVLPEFDTPGSRVLLEGDSVRVGGSVPDAVRERIVGSVEAALGPRFAVATNAESNGAATGSAASEPVAGSEKRAGVPKEPVIHLPTIYFATSSVEVSARARASLLTVAAELKQLPPGTSVRISGFTDSVGHRAANMKMSQRRADAVRKVLVDAGVNPAMLSAKGYGAFHSAGGENRAGEGRSYAGPKGHTSEDRRVELGLAQR